MTDDPALRLAWLDLEFTGLDFERTKVIEIATIVTDSELRILAEGPDLIVHASDEDLANLADFAAGKPDFEGLIEASRRSTISSEEAERQTIDFLRRWIPEGTSPLCGNSVGQDRRVLARRMPELERFFHYRHVDVSTVKELARRWRPDVFEKVVKKETHRALDDIRESIEELRLYRAEMFR